MDLVALIIGIGGLSVTVFFGVLAFRMRPTIDPCWAIRSLNLFKGHLEGLQISYNGHQVKELTVSRIILWNRGRDAILASSVVQPFQVVSSKDVFLLDVKVIQTNNSGNNFLALPIQDSKSCTVNFRYLDRGDGAVFLVIHTGRTSDAITVNGITIGAKGVRKRAVTISEQSQWFQDRVRNGSQNLLSELGYNEDIELGAIINFVLQVWAVLARVVSLSVPAWRTRVPSGLELYKEDLME